jgi:hypothetical protein
MPCLDSMFPRRVAHLMLRCLAALAAFGVLGVGPGTFGQSAGNGQIVGNVRFRSDPSPGTTVTVTGPGLTRSVIADSEGRFDLSNLPQGPYTVTGELAGFQPQRQQNVIVAPGRTTSVALVLSLACLAQVDSVDPGIPWAVKEADTILYLRILASGAPTRWSFSDWCVIGTEHTATVLQVVKTVPMQAALGSAVRFVQLPEGSPYAPGQEYVAMLRWEAAAERYRTVGRFMFPVRDGRVIWTRTDVPALKDEMPVADFISALQAALKDSTPR